MTTEKYEFGWRNPREMDEEELRGFWLGRVVGYDNQRDKEDASGDAVINAIMYD